MSIDLTNLFFRVRPESVLACTLKRGERNDSTREWCVPKWITGKTENNPERRSRASL